MGTADYLMPLGDWLVVSRVLANLSVTLSVRRSDHRKVGDAVEIAAERLSNLNLRSYPCLAVRDWGCHVLRLSSCYVFHYLTISWIKVLFCLVVTLSITLAVSTSD